MGQEQAALRVSKRNCLLDKHDGDILTDWIKVLAVRPHETRLNCFGHNLAGAVPQLTCSDVPVQLLDKGRLRQGRCLMRFGTTENFQKLRSDHVSFKPCG